MSCSRSGVGKSNARAGVTNVVLDSSALLAYLNGEPGAEMVAGIIADSLISSVNLAETITKLVERSGSLEAARDIADAPTSENVTATLNCPLFWTTRARNTSLLVTSSSSCR